MTIFDGQNTDLNQEVFYTQKMFINFPLSIMPSKDILSIQEFQIDEREDQIELYPRAYALPQFFTTNFLHECRTVKIFTGENALLKAFYFNYMKLALEGEDSEDYIGLLKDKFVSFDAIEQGQLEDKFLSDFQYRKFLKDFVDIAKQTSAPNFQSTAQQYPIIDKILQKLFKTVVPIGLFFPQDDQAQTSEFQIAVQVISYLSEEFEEQFEIEIAGKCISFGPTDMHLYFENMNEIYLTYVEEFGEEENINKFQNSADSSFVCGQGNSFTSKFESRSKTGKQPFQKANLNTSPNNLTSGGNKFKQTESSYLSQNCSQDMSSKTSRETSKEGVKGSQKDIEFDEQGESKSKLLQINSNLIRRRGKKENQNIIKKVSILQPIFHQHNEQENGQINSSLAHSGIKQENQDEDKEKAHTLINILDSRVTENNCGLNPLPSTSLQKSDKLSIIARRSHKKSNTMFENIKDECQQENTLKPITGGTTSLSDSAKQLLKMEYQFGMPISLPQPKDKPQKASSSSQNIYTSPTSCYTFKTTAARMEEIVELGEDEDTENSIMEFCEVQHPNMTVSQKTVNLSENVSHKIMIGIIESRNINMSGTSIGHSLTTPYKIDQNPSFFDDGQNSSSITSSSVTHNEELQQSTFLKKETQNVQSEKKSFEQFMKQMKQKLPFAERPKNQIESVWNMNDIGNDSKIHNNFEKKTVKEVNEKKGSQVNFQQSLTKRENETKIQTKSKVQNPSKILNPVKIDPPTPSHVIQQPSAFEASEQISKSYQIGWTATGSDEFTKSDILLLLDEEYRSKIRAIKNEYKSIIREEEGSMVKENWKIVVSNHQDMSLMKQSRQNRTKNQSSVKNYDINNVESRMSSRSRETSIYLQDN